MYACDETRGFWDNNRDAEEDRDTEKETGTPRKRQRNCERDRETVKETGKLRKRQGL